jgi:hypothetical protein
VTSPAIVIEMHPEPTAALVAELHLELCRLRRALGEAWTRRDDLSAAANVLLEAHGSVEALDGLADELAIRATRGDTA